MVIKYSKLSSAALPALLLLSFLANPLLSFGHGISEADRAKALQAGYLEYIELGAHHMITGYDHLLFLFGVIFYLTKFRDIVTFITAFTIGHSITLLFATLFKIQANYFLVDAVIALTVCYKGFDNLDGFKRCFNIRSPNLLGMVTVFGLIHGFGLSTRLQQLPLPEEGLVLKILCFNLGVELGQIAALSVMLLILSGWRKSKSFVPFSNFTNSLLIALGTLLFLMQMHGHLHSSDPEEFPLNQDDHAHIHEDMQRANTQPQPSALDGYKKRFNLKTTEEGNVHTHDGGTPHSH